MCAGLSGKEFVGDGPPGGRWRSGPGRLGQIAGRRIAGAIMRTARRGREGGELRDALRLRAAPRLSDRCLDRTRIAGAVFSAETKGDGAAAARILRPLFRRTGRLRAAVFVSPCPDELLRAMKLLGSAICDIFSA